MRPLHDKDGNEFEVVHSVDLSEDKLKDVADTLGIHQKAHERLKNRKVHIVREVEKQKDPKG